MVICFKVTSSGLFVGLGISYFFDGLDQVGQGDGQEKDQCGEGFRTIVFDQVFCELEEEDVEYDDGDDVEFMGQLGWVFEQ